MSRPKESPIKRFARKMVITGGCWEWKACKNQEGYGLFYDNRMHVAHRWLYEHLIGPIPEGLVMDHLCRNRSCVHPFHLEPVTDKENILRGTGMPARNKRKTECKRGHAFTQENIYTFNNGRTCKACDSMKYFKKKEKREADRLHG